MAAIKVYQPVVVNDVTNPLLPLELIKRIKNLGVVGRTSQLKSESRACNRTTATTGTGGIYGEFQEDKMSKIIEQMWHDPVAMVVRSLTPDGVYILGDKEGIFALPVVSSMSLSDVTVTGRSSSYVSKFAEALGAAFWEIVASLNIEKGTTFQFYFSLGHKKVKEGQIPTVFLSAPTQWCAHLFPHPILLILKARYEKKMMYNPVSKKVNLFSMPDADRTEYWEFEDQEEPPELEEYNLFTKVIDRHPGTKAINKAMAFINTKRKEKNEAEGTPERQWTRSEKNRHGRIGPGRSRSERSRPNRSRSPRSRSERSTKNSKASIIHITQNTNTYDNLINADIIDNDSQVTPATMPTNVEDARNAAAEGRKEEDYYLDLVEGILSGRITGVSYSHPDWVISAICTILNVPFSLVVEKDGDQIEEYSTQASQGNLFFFSKTQEEAERTLKNRIFADVKKREVGVDSNKNLAAQMVPFAASTSDLSWNDLLYKSQFFAETPQGKEMLEEMKISLDTSIDIDADPTPSRIPMTTNREDLIYRLLGGDPPVLEKNFLPHEDKMNEEKSREWMRLVINSFDGELPSPKRIVSLLCSKKGKTVDIWVMNKDRKNPTDPESYFYIKISKSAFDDDENDYNFIEVDESMGWGLNIERVVGSRLNCLRSDYFAKTFFVKGVGLASEYVIHDLNQIVYRGEDEEFVCPDLPPQELSLGEYMSLESTPEKDSGACVVQGLLALYDANVKLGFVHGNATCDACCSVRYNQGLKHPSFSINEEDAGTWVAEFKSSPITMPVFIPEEMGKSRIITERGGWFPHSTILETNLIDEKLLRPQGPLGFPQGPGPITRAKSYESCFELDVFTFISTALIRKLKRRKKFIDGLLGKATQPKARKKRLLPDIFISTATAFIKTIAALNSFASKRVPADHPRFIFLSDEMNAAFAEAFKEKNKYIFMRPEPLTTMAGAATFIDVLKCVISTFGLDQMVVLSQVQQAPGWSWSRPPSEAILRTSTHNISIQKVVESMETAIRSLIADQNTSEYLKQFYDIQMWFAENEASIPTDHAIIPPAKSAQQALHKIQSERRKKFYDILQVLLPDRTQAAPDNIEDILFNPNITSLPRIIMTDTGRYIRGRTSLMDRDNFLPIDLCLEIAQHPGLKRTRQNLTRIYEAVGPLNST